MKLGAHMPTGGGVSRGLERGLGIGCEVVQLFVKNNMQWFGKPHDPAELARYAAHLATGKLACVFGHTGYLINLGAPAGPNREKSVKSLVQELQLAAELGMPFIVLHPGAHLGAGDEAGLRNIVSGLDEVFQATRGNPVRIALENTAGQGSCLGHDPRHLAEIYQRTAHPERLGLCLDTAHFLEAGHDIRTPAGWDRAIGDVASMIGLEQILAFHLNDSKTALGSRVDRHAGIGEGHLGLEAFRHIVNDPRFAAHPGCLETPKSPDLHEDVENLARLRGLIAPKRPPRPARRKACEPGRRTA
jgi:deoxyribonuclease-4